MSARGLPTPQLDGRGSAFQGCTSACGASEGPSQLIGSKSDKGGLLQTKTRVKLSGPTDGGGGKAK